VFNLQGSEIIVILLLALVVLGPEKLPDAVRKFSQTYAELKKMGSGFQTEMKSALDEPMREMRETAKAVRDAADPSKIAAEAEAEARLRTDAETAQVHRLETQNAYETPRELLGDLTAMEPGSETVSLPGEPPPEHPAAALDVSGAPAAGDDDDDSDDQARSA